ncbi:MAG: sigma-70 family RNA polymerase sigma factor [Acidimicrobiales bacterium]
MTDPADLGAGDPRAVDALDRLVRTEGRAVLATLIRTTGRLDLAEDAVQEAVLRALERWPVDGVPDHPRAWLTTVARNRAIDTVRREARRDEKEEAAMRELDAEAPGPAEVETDLLRLVFTCCHPALATDAQVALSLRTLGGLSTPEVARALLVSEATMTKRLTRARQKIAAARIPYRVPPPEDLPERLAGVAATVYLVFNEGYGRPPGPGRDLAVLGVELARLLHELMPDDPTAIGLLGLVLLQHARRAGRFDAAGTAIPLAEQDRSRWDRALVAEGVVLVGEGLRRTPDRPDPYVVQGAIAAAHALAPTWADTPWAAIASWYDVLLAVHDTPVVRLNRAAAIAERDGPDVGLAEVEAITDLEGYALWHASRGELLARVGRRAEAGEAFDHALALGLPAPNAAWVERRRAEVG